MNGTSARVCFPGYANANFVPMEYVHVVMGSVLHTLRRPGAQVQHDGEIRNSGHDSNKSDISNRDLIDVCHVQAADQTGVYEMSMVAV